jgi:EAL domain-containing protein (putative c-di-GMP-specific phosphodiesterase class I)
MRGRYAWMMKGEARSSNWQATMGTVDIGTAVARQASTLDAPRRVTDLATGLPSLTSLFSDLKPLAEDTSGSTILYVHLPANPLIEQNFGWEAQGAYIELVTSYLSRVRNDITRERQHCIVARAFADDYVIVLPFRDDDGSVGQRIAEGMNRHIHAIDADLAALHEVYVGSARAVPVARVHPERLLYRAIVAAQTEATNVGRQRLAAQSRELDRCIARPSVFTIVYQPLVRISDHSIFAYEALTRCREPAFRSPHVLFNVAEQSDRIWPLSRVLRRLALDNADQMPQDTLMFVNLHPRDFVDPELLRPEPWIEDNANRIVFEVTERAAVDDFPTFRRNMETLRANGLRLAIDDLGSGYAALSSVAELSPEFIKFDMTLVRDIHKSTIRQNLLRNMVAFATDANVEVVAEGVEVGEELEVLRELGCHYAQGYYLARPAAPFVQQVSNRPPEREEPPPSS